MMVIPPTGKFLPVYEPNKHLICIAGGLASRRSGDSCEATRRNLTRRSLCFTASGRQTTSFSTKNSGNWNNKTRILTFT